MAKVLDYQRAQMDLTLSTGKLMKILTIAVAVLTLVGLTVPFLKKYAPGLPFREYQLINLAEETNIPTWFSTLALFICSAILGLIAVTKRKLKDHYARHWIALALIFTYLSMDEAACIHDRLCDFLGKAYHLTGIFLFAWVIPGGVVVILVGLAYLRFVLALPSRTKGLVVLSAVLYVGGALLTEMFSSWIASTYGMLTFSYRLVSTFEESLEMSGVALFIYTLLDYIGRQWPALTIRLGD